MASAALHSAPFPQPIAQPAQRLLNVLARPAGVVIEVRTLGQADAQLAEAVQAGYLLAERQRGCSGRPGLREGAERRHVGASVQVHNEPSGTGHRRPPQAR